MGSALAWHVLPAKYVAFVFKKDKWMKHRIIAVAVAAASLPAVAHAQESDMGSGIYAGAQAGHHDFSFGLNSTFVGGYVGYDVPLGERLVAGVEGNASYTVDGDTDGEYGASAHLGYRVGTGMMFGRVGYQEVVFETAGSEGDMLYGIGGEFGFGAKTAFRVTVDTIDFSTARVAGGLTFRF